MPDKEFSEIIWLGALARKWAQARAEQAENAHGEALEALAETDPETD